MKIFEKSQDEKQIWNVKKFRKYSKNPHFRPEISPQKASNSIRVQNVANSKTVQKIRQIRVNSKFLPLEEINAKEIQEFRGPRQVYFDFRPSNVEKNVKTFD